MRKIERARLAIVVAERSIEIAEDHMGGVECRVDLGSDYHKMVMAMANARVLMATAETHRQNIERNG